MSLQESAEMYLKTILILEKRNNRVRAIDIARQLEFSRPTVSQQVKNLAESGYLEVNNRKLISLTLKGREVAEEIYYRHSGLVDFFIWIGVSKDTALEDACRIEHYISQETFDRVQEYLDHCREKDSVADKQP